MLFGSVDKVSTNYGWQEQPPAVSVVFAAGSENGRFGRPVYTHWLGSQGEGDNRSPYPSLQGSSWLKDSGMLFFSYQQKTVSRWMEA